MNITANESADEQFRERVAICMNDGNLSEQAAIDIARIEKLKRDRVVTKQKQATMKWGSDENTGIDQSGNRSR